MNFLAHFYLADTTAASRAGNFLGDFISGTPDSMRATLPDELVDGIIMHRAIDAYTDTHPCFREGKLLLPTKRRRFSGIILDMFTDHFLARDWAHYSPTLSLSDFRQEIYTDLQAYWEYFPEQARNVATWMCEDDWFSRYLTPSGLERSLTGLSKRRKGFHPIAHSSENLVQHYPLFESLCQELLSDAITKYKG